MVSFLLVCNMGEGGKEEGNEGGGGGARGLNRGLVDRERLRVWGLRVPQI